MSQLRTGMAEADWRLVRIKGDPQSAGFTIQRRLEKITALSADTIFAKVNATDTYPTARADSQSYTGPFLNSDLEPIVDGEDAVDIVQTLVKVRNGITDSEWDLVRIDGDPKMSGAKIVRHAKYINPYDADTLFTARNADTYLVNTVNADEQAYAGAFVRSRLSPIKAQDRTVTFEEELTKVDSASTVAALALLTPRATDDDALVHPFSSGGDYVGGTDASTTDDGIFKYTNLSPSQRTAIDAFADTNLVAKIGPAGSGLVRKRVIDEEDRTLTYELTFRDRTIDVTVDAHTQEVNLDHNVVELRQYEQISDSEITVVGDTGTGKTVTTNVSRREDGTFDKSKQVRTAKQHVTAQYTAERTDAYSVARTDTYNSSATPVTLGAGDVAVRQHKTRSNRKNPDGTWDIQNTTRTSDSQFLHAATGTVGYRDSMFVKRFDVTKDWAGVGTRGVTSSVQPRIEDDGTVSFLSRTRTAQAIHTDTYTTQTDCGSTTSAEAYLNSSDSTHLPITKAVGLSKSRSVGRNADGTFNISRRTEDAHIGSDAAAYLSVKDLRGRGWRTGYKNHPSEPTLVATDTYGVLVRRKNRFGLYDGSKLVRAPLVGGALTAWSDDTGLTQLSVIRQSWPSDTNGGKWATRTRKYNVKYFSNSAAATAEIDGGMDGSKTKPFLGGVIWQAVKVYSDSMNHFRSIPYTLNVAP